MVQRCGLVQPISFPLILDWQEEHHLTLAFQDRQFTQLEICCFILFFFLQGYDWQRKKNASSLAKVQINDWTLG